VAAASVCELTSEVEKLQETDKVHQETICHYDAELMV